MSNYSMTTWLGVSNAVRAIETAALSVGTEKRAYLAFKPVQVKIIKTVGFGKAGTVREDRYQIDKMTTDRAKKSPMKELCLFINQLVTKDIAPFQNQYIFNTGSKSILYPGTTFNKAKKEEFKKNLLNNFKIFEAHYHQQHSGFWHSIKSIFSSSYKKAHEETIHEMEHTTKLLNRKK